MAPNRGSVRAWTQDDEEVSDQNEQFEDPNEESGSLDNEDEEDDSVSDDSNDEDEDVEDQDNENPDESATTVMPDLADISFGALAKAQDSLTNTNGKRKRDAPNDDKSRPELLNYLSDLKKKNSTDSRDHKRTKHESRTSKHAPAIQTSSRPVSRKRSVFSPPPSQKTRDPRFDPAISSSSATTSLHADKNYSFLNSYRDTEITALRSQISKSKDPSLTASLKRELMSLTSQQRNAATRSKERELLSSHRKSEKEAISSGKKSTPFYLKQSDIRKEIEKERQESMGKKAREKSAKKKLKKVEGKEKKMMPDLRRSAGMGSGRY